MVLWGFTYLDSPYTFVCFTRPLKMNSKKSILTYSIRLLFIITVLFDPN